MINLIVLVFVLAWFVRTARKLGRNSLAWSLIGFVSYFAAEYLFGRVILPAILGRSPVSADQLTSLIITTVTATIIAGLVGSFIAGFVLVRKGPSEESGVSGVIATQDDGTTKVRCGDCGWKGNEALLVSTSDDPNTYDYCPNCSKRVLNSG